LLAACVVWLSSRALGGPHFGDVGWYHVPIVRWLVAYPAVPGLANLFVQFGHSAQSYFLWAALLEAGPFARSAFHAANGLFVLALMARALLGAARLLRAPRAGSPLDLFYGLCIPAMVALATGIFFTSPFADPLVIALGIV